MRLVSEEDWYDEPIDECFRVDFHDWTIAKSDAAV